MGLFDKIFNSSNTTITYSPKSEQEAWIAIMYACISVDGNVSDAETDKLCQLVVFKTFFKGKNIVDYYKPAFLAHKQIGSKALIDSSASMISEQNKATLFALVMELLLADGILESKEKEIIEYLSTALNLQSDIAQKIVEVMLIKNYGNIVIIN
jgi:uncharacterized tellurite resistance protein B-like protein